MQTPGHVLKIIIGGENSKLRNEKQNKTPGKIEEQSKTQRDKPSTPSDSDDKTPVSVGHHKVPPIATPR